jgi:hypothetical protein
MRTINIISLFLSLILFYNSGLIKLKVAFIALKRLTMRELAAISNNKPYLRSLYFKKGLDII